MIILYLLFLSYTKVSSTDLIADVEKSLEILNSMDTIYVARSCANLIQEILQIAKTQAEPGSSTQEEWAQAASVLDVTTSRRDQYASSNPASLRAILPVPQPAVEGELLGSLIDFDLLGDFAGLGDLNIYLNGFSGEAHTATATGQHQQRQQQPQQHQDEQGNVPYCGNTGMFADQGNFLREGEDGVWMGFSPGLESDTQDPLSVFLPDTWE